jgi:hypothetical protein
VPDARLASDAIFTLTEDLPEAASRIPVAESPDGVSTVTGFHVRNSVTLHIGGELIEFSGVSREPGAFTGCRRGVLGTRAGFHPKGTKVRRLKECFGLFVPDPETSLFEEVAARTAEFYNELGFELLYFDALDGEDILAGAEWGWHYGAKFVFEVARRLKRPAVMEMSTFHPHLWVVRSRMGAWDHPRRGAKKFVDVHAAANEQWRQMFLPTHLGWWSIEPWGGFQTDRTFPDDIEYLCAKALAADSGLSLMGVTPANAPRHARLIEIFRRYEGLRRSGKVPEPVRALLREPGRAGNSAWRPRPNAGRSGPFTPTGTRSRSGGRRPGRSPTPTPPGPRAFASKRSAARHHTTRRTRSSWRTNPCSRSSARAMRRPGFRQIFPPPANGRPCGSWPRTRRRPRGAPGPGWSGAFRSRLI